MGTGTMVVVVAAVLVAGYLVWEWRRDRRTRLGRRAWSGRVDSRGQAVSLHEISTTMVNPARDGGRAH